MHVSVSLSLSSLLRQELSAREGSVKGAEDWLSKLQAHVDAKTVELEGRDKCLQELQMVRRGGVTTPGLTPVQIV